MIIRKSLSIFTVFLLFFCYHTFGQKNILQKADKELAAMFSRIFPFYYGNHDSLELYSDLFSTRIIDVIKTYPASLQYKFKSLADSNACNIVTSSDGLFRIYSWNTWLGGSMRDFKNVFQYKKNNKVFTSIPYDNEGDFGTDFTAVYPLAANNKTYYLAIAGGSLSSKDAYENISVYTITNDTLDDKVKLIKTKSGLNNSIHFEYDFFSVANRPERPIRLIQYDAAKKIIYIPVVLEDGKVTNKFIPYQFTGQYFEKIVTPKKQVEKNN